MTDTNVPVIEMRDISKNLVSSTRTKISIYS